MEEKRIHTINGYCKVRNSTLDMEFLYDVRDGEQFLVRGGCDFERCKYNKECYIVRQAIAIEEE